MKLIKLFVAFCFMLTPFATLAGDPNGPGEPVFNGFSGFAWYQGTGSGLVHERYFCDSNWENCPGHWKWYPEEKWPSGPTDCDADLIEGFLDDVGDGSDILTPGYYFVCPVDGEIFRQKP